MNKRNLLRDLFYILVMLAACCTLDAQEAVIEDTGAPNDLDVDYEYIFSIKDCDICPIPTKGTQAVDTGHVFDTDTDAGLQLANFFGIKRIPSTIMCSALVVCTATEKQICTQYEVWQDSHLLWISIDNSKINNND